MLKIAPATRSRYNQTPPGRGLSRVTECHIGSQGHCESHRSTQLVTAPHQSSWITLRKYILSRIVYSTVCDWMVLSYRIYFITSPSSPCTTHLAGTTYAAIGGYGPPKRVAFRSPDSCETTGIIFEIQMVFDSPAKELLCNPILVTSMQLMTSQVRSKEDLVPCIYYIGLQASGKRAILAVKRQIIDN